jgi:anti-sigma28 factor (negative regulator of flagellin synthesis)
MYTRVYPIEDLIMTIPDFIDAPDFSLNSTSNNQSQNPQSGASGSGNSSSGLQLGEQQKEKKQPTREERAQELVDLIKSIIQPDVWADNGGKAQIRYWNGNLIITAPKSVQEAIGG